METELLKDSGAFGGGLSALDESVLELLPAAAYVCDPRGTIVRFNRKAAELWGREPQIGDQEQRFCGAFRLFRPDGTALPHDETPMARVLESGEPAGDLEVVIERPDGERVWALVNIAPLRDTAGRLTGAVNCFQDITARKRTEAQVQESQRFLEAVVETTPECVKVMAEDGSLARINPAGLTMLEADSPEQIVGKPFAPLLVEEHRAAWLGNHRRVCSGESLSWEFDIVGLKGTRRHLATNAVPLALSDGSVVHLAVTRDVTERRRHERALREGERQLRQLFEALPAAVYTTDAEGRITYYNEAAADLWGHRPPLGDAAWCGSWRLYRPDGSQMDHDECPMALAIKEKRPLRNAEAVAGRPDGSRVPFLAFPTPLHDESGELSGAVNMLIDVSHQKQAEARQQLLINELNHRVKNTLATVQSIAAFSLRGASSAESFRETFGARLMALSRAHDLLTQRRWEGAELTTLLGQEFAPYAAAGNRRVRLRGAEVSLGPRAALVLAMVFHELATNAVKYGALSAEQGRLEISWKVKEGATRAPAPKLALSWSERGGPAVVAPTRRGFGSRLIERSIAGDLEGDVRISYSPEGLRCQMHIPLGRTDGGH